MSNTKASSKVLEVDTDARYTFHEVNKSIGLPHMASQAIFHQRADSSPPQVLSVSKKPGSDRVNNAVTPAYCIENYLEIGYGGFKKLIIV